MVTSISLSHMAFATMISASATWFSELSQSQLLGDVRKGDSQCLSLASPPFLHCRSFVFLLLPVRDEAVTDTPLIKPSLINYTQSPFNAALESERRWRLCYIKTDCSSFSVQVRLLRF
ncbi:hypothetical protein Bca4012_038937 [Brassica carinata]